MKHNDRMTQALGTAVYIAEQERRFSASDYRAMCGAVEIIQRAMRAPIGTATASAKGGGGVTEAEYDGAVLTAIATACLLVNSKLLDPIYGGGGDE